MALLRSLSRFLWRIRFRLLAFNALLVFLPAAGMLFLDTYEKRLLADQERSMVAQGRVLAAALSGRGALSTNDVHQTLVALQQQTGARIRVIDRDYSLVEDSSLLGPQRAAEDEAELETGVLESWWYRVGSAPFRAWRRWLVPPSAPHGSADVCVSGRPLDGSEVRTALAGHYGAATRISSGGQRSVTLYSAVPVRDGKAIVGAVLVSQSTYRILQALYDVRVGVLRVFAASLAAAVALSLVVSHTIARPLVRLRNEADSVIDRRGRLRGRFGVSQRRDEIGDLSRALERLRRRLEDHVLEVETFAGDVSHEFKNPLASIRTAADVLADVESPEERKRFTGVILREVARMERMLSAVREIGKLDTQAEVEDGESVEIGPLVDGLVEAYRLRRPSGGPPVIAEHRAQDLRVYGSPQRFVQVFENLIDNALSVSPSAAPVEISLDRDGDQAVARVWDRGPGIPESDRGRIFDRFFSSRPNAEPDSIHTGLGLAIVKAIVGNAGGSVDAGDRIGGGACFEVRLPLHDERAA